MCISHHSLKYSAKFREILIKIGAKFDVGLGSGLDGYGQVGSGNSSLALRYFPLILAARGAALPSKLHETALRNRMKTHFDIA